MTTNAERDLAEWSLPTTEEGRVAPLLTLVSRHTGSPITCGPPAHILDWLKRAQTVTHVWCRPARDDDAQAIAANAAALDELRRRLSTPASKSELLNESFMRYVAVEREKRARARVQAARMTKRKNKSLRGGPDR